MKAVISDIKRFAVHDGRGIRTTVFFKGCPLRCVWCHNPESIGFKPQIAYYGDKCVGCGECEKVCGNGAQRMTEAGHFFDRSACSACGRCEEVCLGEAIKLYGRETTADELVPLLLEDADFFETTGGGVTLSGGECLCRADFCAELLRRLKENGINTAVDTCGAVPREAFEKVIPYTDTFLYDIKAIDEDLHIRYTGAGNGAILDNARRLDAAGCEIEFRVPYVPGVNDGEIGKIASLLRTLRRRYRVRVLPYHSYAGSKYAALDMENTLPRRIPGDAEVREAERILNGL
ncbi:MAG: glycyl-radical enzyme activating protein [Clostridia bacterium]|nr:glycyl-radical enzyme activating protein [Clostridia bacterium]